VKLGAIDIGSNAARLLIVEVIPDKNNIPQFNKLSLVRVPFRLGFDVFEFGTISQKKVEMMMQTMKAFSHLLKAYEVNHLIACATSAMREAGNSA
jgi:exopolyphosphatase/guanosine-5'-triphosphate,3'-diphosphate pyrophosphatase